ncbi:MAG TPA: hypothetical protein VI455_12645 [Terriglobia bacterium]
MNRIERSFDGDPEMPALRIRAVEQAPLATTMYELVRLRCKLCREVFEAEAPQSVGEEKYDQTAAAMIGSLKYSSRVPFCAPDRRVIDPQAAFSP